MTENHYILLAVVFGLGVAAGILYQTGKTSPAS